MKTLKTKTVAKDGLNELSQRQVNKLVREPFGRNPIVYGDQRVLDTAKVADMRGNSSYVRNVVNNLGSGRY